MRLATTEEKLNERIKELSCLYEMSTVFLKNEAVHETLQEICDIVQVAWRFPESATVHLTLDYFEFFSGTLPQSTVFQRSDIIIFGDVRGQISVHYDSAKHTEDSFLDDEMLLLRKIASEIRSFYEKRLTAEEIILLKRSAERSDRLVLLGEITAGIAHELNTPLGNILGFAELIEGRTNEPQTKQDIAKVIKAAIYSREIVKKLMFFSCEMPQHMQLLKVQPIVEQALKLLEPNFRKAGVSYELTMQNPEVEAQLDPIQLTQVLFNILVNAIYVAPPQSIITISINDDQHHLILEIADQGPGIDPLHSEKIFEPFFTTKPFGEGNGLGLSVVHGIVKSHRGEISTSYNTPSGTIFTIRLPLKH